MSELNRSDSVCRTCRHYVAVAIYRYESDPFTSEGYGDCRRHAPEGRGWPCVDSEAKCGDHEKQDAKIRHYMDEGNCHG